MSDPNYDDPQTRSYYSNRGTYFERFQEMRERGELLDGRLSAGGAVQQVHIVFLAIHSGYLRRLFTELAPTTFFEFDNITARGLKEAVDFAYNGRIRMNSEVFGDIMDAAVCLEFDELIGVGEDFASHRPHLWVQQMNIAEKYEEARVSRRVMQNADVRQICELLSSDQFRPLEGQEVRVLKHALAWLEFHKAEWERLPRPDVDRLHIHVLQTIRYGLLPNMVEVLEESARAGVSAQALSAWLEYHNHPVRQPFLAGYCTRSRHGKRHRPNLLLIGGNNGNTTTKTVFVKPLEGGDWEPRGELPGPLGAFAATIVNNFVYIAGGQSCTDGLGRSACNTMYRLNTVTGVWMACARMRHERSYFPLCRYGQDLLVAAGGIRNTALREVEVYDMRRNTWSSTRPLLEPLSGHAGVSVGGNVYVCGGINDTSHVQDVMVRYERGQWCRLGRMLSPRVGHTASVHGSSIIVCGGTVVSARGDYSHVMRMESYNVLNGQWTTLAPPPVKRTYASACMWMHELYVMGGYDMNTLSAADTLHVYDVMRDVWREEAGCIPDTRAKFACLVLPPPEACTGPASHAQCPECRDITGRITQTPPPPVASAAPPPQAEGGRAEERHRQSQSDEELLLVHDDDQTYVKSGASLRPERLIIATQPQSANPSASQGPVNTPCHQLINSPRSPFHFVAQSVQDGSSISLRSCSSTAETGRMTSLPSLGHSEQTLMSNARSNSEPLGKCTEHVCRCQPDMIAFTLPNDLTSMTSEKAPSSGVPKSVSSPSLPRDDMSLVDDDDTSVKSVMS